MLYVMQSDYIFCYNSPSWIVTACDTVISNNRYTCGGYTVTVSEDPVTGAIWL